LIDPPKRRKTVTVSLGGRELLPYIIHTVLVWVVRVGAVTRVAKTKSHNLTTVHYTVCDRPKGLMYQ
jgi:hypothetical protein